MLPQKINGVHGKWIKFLILIVLRPLSSNQEQFSFQRERSMEDINKDIETIWKELQEIDKITRGCNQNDR